MIKVQRTDTFIKWLNGLKDARAVAKIIMRIERAQRGNLGDVKSVGENVSEMRINHGPGYRLYYLQRGNTLIILLAGGDKNSQSRDIRRAQQQAKVLSRRDS